MVECGREYVLQWPGHAAYVTERFSGLLARQTLVDVTLICDEQKLRVHKLVLASCSLYFEEILTEDLGPEPVILLKDLKFSTLKAMIEFMYCGETTVSHICLPSLLSAARLFKVKELESLVEKMVGSGMLNQRAPDAGNLEKKEGRVNGIIKHQIASDDNGIRVSFGNKHTSNGHCQASEASESSDSGSERSYLENNIFSSLSDSLNERCLYEEPFVDNRRDRTKNKSVKCFSSNPKRKTENVNGISSHCEESIESESDPSTLDSEHEEKTSEPNLYQQYCGGQSNGCENEKIIARDCPSPECLIEVNRVGQCSRFKRRNSLYHKNKSQELFRLFAQLQ
ncbi:hypothetical protein QAD02_017732 [Eretmocerus hayati]|uniref:Uncharacterized protein n=1 Tax=Eretmocerus hayati TaxID=131215 RepID=A0ACC2PEG7_9HYME|nr:hypothetical protein QAD02_017732 [Eretmocerus hayati]